MSTDDLLETCRGFNKHIIEEIVRQDGSLTRMRQDIASSSSFRTAHVPDANRPFCRLNLLKPTGHVMNQQFNPINPELNLICYLLALLGAHHFFHVSRI